MSAVQHTPGPWNASCCDVPANKCEPGDTGLRFWSVCCENDGDAFRGYIATVHAAHHLEHGKGISVAERDANACLIAAAPDLRKATALALHLLRELTEEGDLDPAESVILGREELTVTRALHELQKALAMAEGRP